jgi:hypothetical protein
MITISIEIHFTALYMADLGTRTGPLGEGGKEPAEERALLLTHTISPHVILHSNSLLRYISVVVI